MKAEGGGQEEQGNRPHPDHDHAYMVPDMVPALSRELARGAGEKGAEYGVNTSKYTVRSAEYTVRRAEYAVPSIPVPAQRVGEKGEGRKGERRFWTTSCWTTRAASTRSKPRREKNLRQFYRTGRGSEHYFSPVSVIHLDNYDICFHRGGVFTAMFIVGQLNHKGGMECRVSRPKTMISEK